MIKQNYFFAEQEDLHTDMYMSVASDWSIMLDKPVTGDLMLLILTPEGYLTESLLNKEFGGNNKKLSRIGESVYNTKIYKELELEHILTLVSYPSEVCMDLDLEIKQLELEHYFKVFNKYNTIMKRQIILCYYALTAIHKWELEKLVDLHKDLPRSHANSMSGPKSVARSATVNMLLSKSPNSREEGKPTKLDESSNSHNLITEFNNYIMRIRGEQPEFEFKNLGSLDHQPDYICSMTWRESRFEGRGPTKVSAKYQAVKKCKEACNGFRL